jgi:hypothetical protein
MPTLFISELEADQILGHDKQKALATAVSAVRRARAVEAMAKRNRELRSPYIGGPAEGEATFTDTDGTTYPPSDDAGFPSPRDPGRRSAVPTNHYDDNPGYSHSLAAARAAHPSSYGPGGDAA